MDEPAAVFYLVTKETVAADAVELRVRLPHILHFSLP
jgi:hypothetical protein